MRLLCVILFLATASHAAFASSLRHQRVSRQEQLTPLDAEEEATPTAGSQSNKDAIKGMFEEEDEETNAGVGKKGNEVSTLGKTEAQSPIDNTGGTAQAEPEPGSSSFVRPATAGDAAEFQRPEAIPAGPAQGQGVAQPTVQEPLEGGVTVKKETQEQTFPVQQPPEQGAKVPAAPAQTQVAQPVAAAQTADAAAPSAQSSNIGADGGLAVVGAPSSVAGPSSGGASPAKSVDEQRAELQRKLAALAVPTVNATEASLHEELGAVDEGVAVAKLALNEKIKAYAKKPNDTAAAVPPQSTAAPTAVVQAPVADAGSAAGQPTEGRASGAEVQPVLNPPPGQGGVAPAAEEATKLPVMQTKPPVLPPKATDPPADVDDFENSPEPVQGKTKNVEEGEDDALEPVGPGTGGEEDESEVAPPWSASRGRVAQTQPPASVPAWGQEGPDSFGQPVLSGEEELRQSESSHFMTFAVSAAILVAVAYLLYHNKHKLLGLVVEGRGGRELEGADLRRAGSRRTSNGAKYRKLEQEDQEQVLLKGGEAANNVIY